MTDSDFGFCFGSFVREATGVASLTNEEDKESNQKIRKVIYFLISFTGKHLIILYICGRFRN